MNCDNWLEPGGTPQSQNESETPLMVRLECRFESLAVTWPSVRGPFYSKWAPLQPSVYKRFGETKSLLESTALMAENRSMLKRDFTT
jgi:hypothetical protein